MLIASLAIRNRTTHSWQQQACLLRTHHVPARLDCVDKCGGRRHSEFLAVPSSKWILYNRCIGTSPMRYILAIASSTDSPKSERRANIRRQRTHYSTTVSVCFREIDSSKSRNHYQTAGCCSRNRGKIGGHAHRLTRVHRGYKPGVPQDTLVFRMNFSASSVVQAAEFHLARFDVNVVSFSTAGKPHLGSTVHSHSFGTCRRFVKQRQIVVGSCTNEIVLQPTTLRFVCPIGIGPLMQHRLKMCSTVAHNAQAR